MPFPSLRGVSRVSMGAGRVCDLLLGCVLAACRETPPEAAPPAAPASPPAASAGATDDGAVDGGAPKALKGQNAEGFDLPQGPGEIHTFPEAKVNYSDVEHPVLCGVAGTERFACFVPIPGGTYLQGAQASAKGKPGYDPLAEPDEAPVREVTVSPFFLQMQEIAVIQFDHCVKKGACRDEDVAPMLGLYNGRDLKRMDYPANGVTHRGATDYCRMIGARLPTEAEFEWALRHMQATHPPLANGPTCGSAAIRSAKGERCDWRTTAVIYREPGAGELVTARLQHLFGNVWEWTSDWYGPYTAGPQKDPTGPATGELRVLRGAAYTTDDPKLLRAASRNAMEPDARLDDVGFRCALSKMPD